MKITTRSMRAFALLGSVTLGLLFTQPAACAQNLYVANTSNGTIEQLNSSGGGTQFASGLSSPYGVAFDLAGNLYVANQGTGNNTGTIEKFTPGGVGSVFASTGAGRPVGLAFDAAGNLYVSNPGDSTIEEFAPSGLASTFATTPGYATNGLAFDTAGNLYAAYGNASTIEKFTPGGVGSVFASGGALADVLGLAFDSAGNLYATANGSIEKYTPGGVGSVFANTGLSGPSFLAFQVPEPSTWVLLGVGMSGLGVWSLHRRRVA